MRISTISTFRQTVAAALEIDASVELDELDSLMLFELLLVVETSFGCLFDDEILSRVSNWDDLYGEHLRAVVSDAP